jgi:hypothetical protein
MQHRITEALQHRWTTTSSHQRTTPDRGDTDIGCLTARQ